VLFNACPDGTHAMGGGAIAGAVPRQAFLNAQYPFPGTTDPPDAGFVASIHNAGRSTELRNFVACKT
jgi:hypothetical protein